MSKRLKRFLFISGGAIVAIIVAVVLIFRSHSTDAHLRVVPKDAAIVLRIDVKQLARKADPAKLLQHPAFKKAAAKSWPALFNDPFGSGIDPLENVYGFAAKKENGVCLAIVFNVDDAEQLVEFAKTAGIGQAVEKEDHYLIATTNSYCVAWNDEAGVLLYSEGNAPEVAATYLRQPEERSVTQNEAYVEFAAKKNDLGLFINNKQLALLSGSLSTIGITDGYGEVAVNFEDEKISAVYANHPATASVIPVIRTDGQNKKQFEAIAPQQPIIYFGIATDLNLLFPALNSDEAMKENIASTQMALGLTDNEVKKLFTGDVSIAVTDYRDISKYDPRIQANTRRMLASGEADEEEDLSLFVPMLYISIGETDDERVNEMLTDIGMTKMENAWAAPGLDLIVYTAAKNGHLLITNDFYAADTLGKTGTLPGKLPAGIATDSPIVTWVDLDQTKFPKTITSPEAGSMEADFAAALPFLQPFASIQLKGQTNHSELEIKMTKGEGNSLYRLLTTYASLVQ